jgi:hypothetical protein
MGVWRGSPTLVARGEAAFGRPFARRHHGRRTVILDIAVRSQARNGGSMAFTFNLETTDGTPADSSSFTSVAPQWRPGDRIPLGPGRALRVVG